MLTCPLRLALFGTKRPLPIHLQKPDNSSGRRQEFFVVDDAG